MEISENIIQNTALTSPLKFIKRVLYYINNTKTYYKVIIRIIY